jgi:aspartyl-tRNA(Asn)/glutamyl-tRNA(Gln) amidotransferase subunit C
MSAKLDVRDTAQLSRLELSEAEAARFQEQLSQVLVYVDKLREVNVDSVEPTAHSSALHNVFREDAPRDWFTSEVALQNAPRQANHLIIVPKVVE